MSWKYYFRKIPFFTIFAWNMSCQTFPLILRRYIWPCIYDDSDKIKYWKLILKAFICRYWTPDYCMCKNLYQNNKKFFFDLNINIFAWNFLNISVLNCKCFCYWTFFKYVCGFQFVYLKSKQRKASTARFKIGWA